MAIAQGISKQVAFRKRTSLAVVGSATPQLMRRETGSGEFSMSTFGNNEINSYQQDTGVTNGLRSSAYNLSGVLSPLTYSSIFASVLRKAFAATTAQTSKAITIGSATAGVYPLTVGSGTLLSGGFKVGDVIRLSVGALNAANISKNLIITALPSETSASVRPVNGVALVPEGPVAGCTVTVVGKKVIAQTSGHTQEYWDVEEWFSDVSISDLYQQLMVGSVDVGLPSEGNATVAISMAGLNKTQSGSQVMTGATAETTTPVLTAVNGILIVNGLAVGYVTGASLKIDGKAANMGAVVGSNTSPDIQRGRISVSGQLTVYLQDNAMTTLYEAGTKFGIVLVVSESSAADAKFVSFSMSSCKYTGDSKDDGEKGIIQTMPFTAELNGAGGTALANDKTIISIQDSDA
jgi:hypothetical protein